MIVDTTPIRATALNLEIGRDCIAYLTFRNWGQVATDYVCLVYQISADGLSVAVDTYIDLTDLDAATITSKLCTGTSGKTPPPGFSVVPSGGACMVVPGVPTEDDILYSVEVFCYNGGAEPKKYLGIYEMNASYHQMPYIRIPEVYATDRSLNPGYVEIDPAAAVLARGIFSGITANIRLDDNTTISNIPVSVSSFKESAHTISMVFDLSIGATSDRKITDIIFIHSEYGTIGRITNLFIPMSAKITYITDINTQLVV